MHDDFGNMFGVFKPHVFPAFAAILTFIHAVAVGHRALIVVFPGAYPYHRRVGRIKGNAADGVRPLVIKNGLKGYAAVGCFPNAAR